MAPVDLAPEAPEPDFPTDGVLVFDLADSELSRSPDSMSSATAGLSNAFGVIWPVFPGARNSFLPPGRGI